MINYTGFAKALHMRHEVTVNFLRKDGTTLTVRCALRDGGVNHYNITVWDLEKNIYRNIPKSKIVWYK